MTDVTCAIIRNDDEEVLIVQRGENSDHPYKWEFPGGKTAPGESHEDCVVREVAEELGMQIIIRSCLEPVEHDYGKKKIRLIPFICDTLDDLPVLSEHIDFRWLKSEKLSEVDFCEADILIARSYIVNSTKVVELKEGKKAAEPAELSDNEQLQQMLNSIIIGREVEWVAASALENHEIFLKLLQYSYSSEKQLAFRSSWVLTKVCDKFPEIIEPHLPEMVDSLQKIDNESVIRSFLRIISFTDPIKFSEKHRGILADYCFAALNSATSAIAVKVYSMEILYNLTVLYPQLANELASVIRIMMEDGTAALVSRGNSILKKITSIPLD
jgi:8-oxo-dGTP diphosphatase